MPSRVHNITESVKRFFTQGRVRSSYKSTTGFIRKRPMTAFIIALLLLFAIIVIGNILSRPKAQKPPTAQVKSVQTYNIGSTPTATFQGKVEKSGVIKIVALAPGIVQSINVTEGDHVSKGQQLLSLSTNYQGGNAPALQADIAQAQYQNAANTQSQQTDVINKQKEIADINKDNYTDQQAIASQSASQTSSLIDANQTVLDQLNQQLAAAQAASTPQATIIQQQSTINQLQAAQNQLRQGLATAQQQTDNGKPPGRLANTQHDLTIEQLDLQQKTLELNVEVSKLQADVASVNAATMYPASPVAGIVERIFVRVGQQVTPGTQLAVITATDPKTTVVVNVPKQVAQNISSHGASTIYIGNKSYSVNPTFVSTEATDGLLYSVIYTLPDTATEPVTDGEYVKVVIPIGSVDTSSVVPFVPLDAIFQTQDSNYVLVAEHGKGVARKISLGNVFGSYVEVTSGLQAGDEVILDRNIVAGDRVTTQ